MEPKLNLGDTVYYQRYGSPGGEHKAEPSPAIVTQIFEDGTTCQLFVMNPNGTYFNIICGRFIQLEYGCPGAHS